jgi:hypothetical protein
MKALEITGEVVELGACDAATSQYMQGLPAVEVKVDGQTIVLAGLTVDQVRDLPPVLYKRVSIKLELK